MFNLGRPPFKETLGCHLVQSDLLHSGWVVHLSKRYVGLSSPFKWHVKFNLGRPPFKETNWVVTSYGIFKLDRQPFKATCWVVTWLKLRCWIQEWVVISLQMTCYIQVGSSCFQRHTLDCHLLSNGMLSSSWIIRLSKRQVGLSPRSSDMLNSSWVVRLLKRHVGLSLRSKWHVMF